MYLLCTYYVQASQSEGKLERQRAAAATLAAEVKGSLTPNP